MYQISSASSSEALDTIDVVAIVVSIFAPGLGHILLGQVKKGLLILLGVVASCGVGYLISAVIALDAYLLARALKLRDVGEWEIFPERERFIAL